MFIARIYGTILAAAKHETMEACRYLLAQRLEADNAVSGEPLVVVDWLGAGIGSKVIVSTDGDIARARFGNNTPVRNVVVGLVDSIHVSHGGQR